MSEENPFKNNYTAYIEQKNKEIQSKDQQIKDLTILLEKADELIRASGIDYFNIFEVNQYNQSKQSYQQKYHKP